MRTYPIKFYFKLFRLHLKLNGLLWTLMFSIRHVTVEISRVAGNVMRGLEQKHNLPGSHSVAENELKWNHYSWERGENEWTQSEEWKSSLIEHVMLKNIAPGHVVVEIGPGFGRWTRKLIELSKRLIVVDVTEKCIAHCKRLFADKDNVEFHINDGRSLDVAADNSVDYIWSFDVFVHIEPPDIEHYLREFRRILKNDGIAIIHHGIAGKTDLSWRSSLTLEVFTALLEKHDFALLQQFDCWGDNEEYRVISSDVISIFKKA